MTWCSFPVNHMVFISCELLDVQFLWITFCSYLRQTRFSWQLSPLLVMSHEPPLNHMVFISCESLDVHFLWITLCSFPVDHLYLICCETPVPCELPVVHVLWITCLSYPVSKLGFLSWESPGYAHMLWQTRFLHPVNHLISKTNESLGFHIKWNDIYVMCIHIL